MIAYFYRRKKKRTLKKNCDASTAGRYRSQLTFCTIVTLTYIHLYINNSILLTINNSIPIVNCIGVQLVSEITGQFEK